MKCAVCGCDQRMLCTRCRGGAMPFLPQPMTRWLRDASVVAAGVYLALTLYYLTLEALVILPAALRLW